MTLRMSAIIALCTMISVSMQTNTYVRLRIRYIWTSNITLETTDCDFAGKRIYSSYYMHVDGSCTCYAAEKFADCWGVNTHTCRGKIIGVAVNMNCYVGDKCSESSDMLLGQYPVYGNIGECNLGYEDSDVNPRYYSEYMFDIVDLPDPRWPTYLVVSGALAAVAAVLIVSIVIRRVWKNKFRAIQAYNVVLLEDVAESGGASS